MAGALVVTGALGDCLGRRRVILVGAGVLLLMATAVAVIARESRPALANRVIAR